MLLQTSWCCRFVVTCATECLFLDVDAFMLPQTSWCGGFEITMCATECSFLYVDAFVLSQTSWCCGFVVTLCATEGFEKTLDLPMLFEAFSCSLGYYTRASWTGFELQLQHSNIGPLIPWGLCCAGVLGALGVTGSTSNSIPGGSMSEELIEVKNWEQNQIIIFGEHMYEGTFLDKCKTFLLEMK